jgi:DNA mismatch repair protein MutS
MRQYRAFQAEQPGCVIFMRMGDFYELFFDDAVEMNKALGLTLTERPKGVPMAGFPHHQLATYLKRAVDQGYHIAVADQLEDPSQAKGVVRRGITQVITPGTLVDETLVTDETIRRLAAIAFGEASLSAAVVDLSTGEFTVIDEAPGRSITDALARFGVGELLYCETANGQAPTRVEQVAQTLGAPPTARPAWHFRPGESLEAIQNQYGVASVEGFGLTDDDPAIPAIGVVLRYLAETQALSLETGNAGSGSDFQDQTRTLVHLRPPKRLTHTSECCIDAVSLRSLEIEQTLRSGQIEGSLLGVFLRPANTNRALFRTPMGKRLIRAWLTAPCAKREAIEARQSAVAAFVQDDRLCEQTGQALAGIQDVARIAGRVALGRATPRDLVALGTSIARTAALLDTTRGTPALLPLHESFSDLTDALEPLAERITTTCVDSPPAHLRDGGLIRDGIDAELDEARGLQKDAGEWLADYQKRLIEQYDLPSLKVGYNKVFGYYAELPTAQARRAPPELTRKQTLKNAERYITPELKAFEDKVTHAQARANERERAIFSELCTAASDRVTDLGRFADAVAELDCLLALSEKARLSHWVRPEILDEPVLDIKSGRHPVLDETLEGRFVPNTTTLATDGQAPLALITGPNMSGKSTFIRQSALLMVLAQIGSFIPADSARIGIADRIFTRVGSDDALHRGQSTFMVEMTETANILNNATGRSLVILDEIGRGTSTLDGLSLAWAITEHLAERQTRTLFATHYHELTDLEDRLPGQVRNLHVAVREWETEGGGEEIVFLHEIRPGRTDQSYGIHVARLAGVPESVTRRAREILETLAVQHTSPDTGSVAPPEPQDTPTRRKPDQMSLFAEPQPHPAVDRLREIKIETLTPLEAFDLLRQLTEQVE